MANKAWSPADTERAVNLYRATDMSAADIGGLLGFSKDTVLHVLRANHIPIRPQGRPSYNTKDKCLSFEKMAAEARFGSQRLLEAIQRAGVWPA